MSENFVGQVVSSGVDWVTCIYKDRELEKRLQIALDELVHQEYADGNKIKPWGMAGYRGWVCGGVQCGEREDGWCVRLSSEVARLNWWDFYQECDNITRLDCQVTVRFPGDPAAMVVKAEQQAKRFKKKHKAKWECRWVGSTDGSRTLYIGSRWSDHFMRIYDKSRQSKNQVFQGCARYEVQFNRWLARYHASRLADKDTVQGGSAARCSAFMMDHGVSQQFPAKDMSHVCASVVPKNSARSLRWLTEQVRPTVQHLISIGLYSEVCAALGVTLGSQPGNEVLELDHETIN